MNEFEWIDPAPPLLNCLVLFHKVLNHPTIFEMRASILILILVTASSIYQKVFSQDMVSSTKVSQKSIITQRIGTTDVTVVYHSPLAKGRKIFGNVVPYDFMVEEKEYPWRAGSNQNTTIEFNHDVEIEGQKLAAGSYGLHIFVKEKEWTFIFSKNYKSWGSFQYDKAEDALRVSVKAEDAHFQEWLSYRFINRAAESSDLELRWAEKKAHINIKTDVSANIQKALIAKEEKTWQDYMYLTRISLEHSPKDLDKALEWIDQSIATKTTFHNMSFKADLLIQKGNKKEGKALKDKAMTFGKGFDFYYYGLGLYLLDGKKKEAYKVLSDNVKNNPKDWVAHLAMGEYYIKEGNQKKVVEHFKQAYENAPEGSKNYARYMYLSNKVILENSLK